MRRLPWPTGIVRHSRIHGRQRLGRSQRLGLCLSLSLGLGRRARTQNLIPA